MEENKTREINKRGKRKKREIDRERERETWIKANDEEILQ